MAVALGERRWRDPLSPTSIPRPPNEAAFDHRQAPVSDPSDVRARWLAEHGIAGLVTKDRLIAVGLPNVCGKP